MGLHVEMENHKASTPSSAKLWAQKTINLEGWLGRRKGGINNEQSGTINENH